MDWQSEARGMLDEQAAGKGLKGGAAKKFTAVHTPQSGQRQPKPSGLLPRPPEKLRRLADPYDPAPDLTARARSYPPANGSTCHVEAGGGNARMGPEFTTPADQMRLIGEPPVHQAFDRPDARLVTPGHPERSVLLRRVGTRGSGQMPPPASNRVDERGLTLLREWVESLK